MKIPRNKKLAAKKPRASMSFPFDDTYARIRAILEQARTAVAHTVNTTQVVANWLIGREILEEEQGGQRRASYGASIMKDLSARLQAEFGSGYSEQNLRYMRQFYREYPDLLSDVQIRHTSRGKFSIALNSQILHAARGKSLRTVGMRRWCPLPSNLTKLRTSSLSHGWSS